MALVCALAVISIAIVLSMLGDGAAATSSSNWSAVPASTTRSIGQADETVTTQPPLLENEFLPKDANLSDCVGFVERPGCGSEARGGLQMTLIFLALAVGLGIVFWRISVGVKQNRAAQPADRPPSN